MKRITALILAAVLCFGLLSAAVSGEDVPVPETSQVHKIAFSTLEALASKGDDEVVAVNLWLRGPSREALEAMTPVEKPGSDATTEERNAYASAYAQTKESVYSGIMSAFVRKYLDETEQVLQEEYDSAPGIGVYVHKSKLAALEALDEVIWINKIGRSIILVEQPAPEEKLADPLREYIAAQAPDKEIPVRIWLRGPSGDEFGAIVSAEYPTLSSPPEAFQAYRTASEQAANELGNDVFMYRLFMDNHREDFSNILFESDENFPVMVATLRTDKIESLAALKMVSQIDTAFGYDEALPDPELPEDPAQRKKIEKQLQKFMNIAGHDELIPVSITLREPAEISVLGTEQGDRDAVLEANRKVFSALTTEFVLAHLNEGEQIFFKANYGPFVTAEVAKHKIAGLAALDEVTSIDWALGHDDPVYSDDGKDYVYVTAEKPAEPAQLDKSALAAAIVAAQALDLDKYTEESDAGLKVQLEIAKYILVKPDATQEEIDAAANALNDFIQSLTISQPIKRDLAELIADAGTIDLIRYTEQSAALFEEEFEKARYILAKEDATQAEIDAAYMALEDAIAGLIKIHPPEPPQFEDVRDHRSFYFTPVYWAYNAQITNGTDEVHFGPEEACTRGQVVTFLWRAAGEPEPRSVETAFTDVGPKAFYARAVAWAVEQGITKGMNDTTFAPDATCTRGQIVTFLWRFRQSPAPKSTGTPFTDVGPKAFYAKAVAWAVEDEITNGMTKTTFAPDATCTRGQVVTFLYRATAG